MVSCPEPVIPNAAGNATMDLATKLQILSGAARYDASCAAGGGSAQARRRAGGAGGVGGICHSWTSDGRCVSLLKILLSNRCRYDCAYCVNRRSNDLPRAAFTPEEVVRLTLEFYRRNYIEGLFLSSGVDGSPDATVERMVRIAAELRRRYRFRGYIHLKMIPGVTPELVRQAGLLADRLSVNIELPSAAALAALAPEKNRDGILRPMQVIGNGCQECRLARRDRPPPFAPAGQSTQLIIGASPEDDRHILDLAQHLYRVFHLRRVYYSAYTPVNADARLPDPDSPPPLLREHRLYQADWLLRHYGFAVEELLDPAHPQLELDLDPKAGWALRHPERFPVDLAHAPYEELLRIPGIGVTSAKRIIAVRGTAPLDFADLPKLGVVMKRARQFILLRGRRDPEATHCQALSNRRGRLLPAADTDQVIQPELFGASSLAPVAGPAV